MGLSLLIVISSFIFSLLITNTRLNDTLRVGIALVFILLLVLSIVF